MYICCRDDTVVIEEVNLMCVGQLLLALPINVGIVQHPALVYLHLNHNALIRLLRYSLSSFRVALPGQRRPHRLWNLPDRQGFLQHLTFG